jgi:NCAIR mutase (PurE)-related protein
MAAAPRGQGSTWSEFVDNSELLQVLSQVARGDLSIDVALREVEGLQQRAASAPLSAPTPNAMVDLDRMRRCGVPEVVYGPNKTPQEVVDVFRALREHRQPCLATRVNAEQVAAVLLAFPEAVHNGVANTVRICGLPTAIDAHVAIITAGTGDRPVAEEARETLLWMGVRCDLIYDVGVAGPHRLPSQKHRFEQATAIVVVAGMEAALPSVVAGHVSCPVIGVPTSVGYGANLGGVAALLSMLNSCAANVSVVNIDAGFKGGYIAGLIARSQSAAGRTRS